MLPSFAVVVGGHNFRPEAAARQRHRVSRKFDYLTKKYGRGSVCVGCGRCGRQCTSHIDIYDIVSDLIKEGGR
jgi:ferredoxin